MASNTPSSSSVMPWSIGVPAIGRRSLRQILWVGLVAASISRVHGADTSLISLDSSAGAGNGPSYSPDVSSTGRWVAFTSPASNLVPDDTNLATDVYLRDRKTGQTQRVSVDSTGAEGNAPSLLRSLSADGRWIAFVSLATDLVPNDTNGSPDLFVHDRVSGATTRASVADDESEGNGTSEEGSLSADGRYLAFRSAADNLVNDDTNGRVDVFVRDLQAGTTERVSIASGGAEGNGQSTAPALSADGQQVAFASRARNLVPGDGNARSDVFVHDRGTGETKRVSVAADGSEGNGDSVAPSLSADGTRVAFASRASNLVIDDRNGAPGPDPDTAEGQDVFVHDLSSGDIQRGSVASDGTEAMGPSGRPAISADGLRVVFESDAENLVADDTNLAKDVFVHDLPANQTSRMSVDSAGVQGNLFSEFPELDDSGRRVAYHALANNLVLDDVNAARDVFLHDRGAECDVNAAVHQFVLPVNQWRTLTLPCDPPPGTTLADLFGDDIAGNYASAMGAVDPVWVVYTYDAAAATPSYENLELDGELRAGEAFWIIQRTDAAVVLDLPVGSRGSASHFRAGQACTSELGCQDVPLSGRPGGGWNLVGNPFNVAVEQTAVRVTTTSGACTDAGCSLDAAFALPEPERVAGNVLFAFDGTDYQSIDSSSVIEPWQGFWVRELAGSSENAPNLHFPENR